MPKNHPGRHHVSGMSAHQGVRHQMRGSRPQGRRHVDYYQAIEIPLLEDRSAIQHALTEVARAIANNNMDTKRAGLLLYSLQIASQNARNQDEIIGGEKQVREVTRTEEGTDLGPETTASDSPATMP